jgi:CBS domain-containing protein
LLVAEILKTKGAAVFTISPDATLAGAASQLVERQVGALIVCENERVAGVLSARDVVRALAREGADALGQPVRAHMTAEVVFAEPGEGVSTLMGRMTDRRIRHLPVMKDERLCGVISIGDVVKCQIEDATREAESLKSYIVAG